MRMLVVISPAKRLDWVRDWRHSTALPQTEPAFLPDALSLAQTARALSAADLAKLMTISPKLATLNHDRFQAFSATPAAADLRPAALAFAGDTYAGLDAPSIEADAMLWAQDHLRILSGLYGLLRPLDAIQAYRLEMGSRLANDRGATLYDYWGDTLARALNAQAAEIGGGVVVNCASVEYFSAVDLKALTLPVITPVFLEGSGPDAKIVSFYAKKARGAMARFIIENRLKDPADLAEFRAGGYRHNPALSSPERLVFERPTPQ